MFFILILSEGGIPLFSYPFTDGPHIDDHLISGFLTAFTAIGKDTFAATGVIDGITYKDYTVVVKSQEPVLVCYIFQGPSYFALQKLDQFFIRIHETLLIYQALDPVTPPDVTSKALGALEASIQSSLTQLLIAIFPPLSLNSSLFSCFLPALHAFHSSSSIFERFNSFTLFTPFLVAFNRKNHINLPKRTNARWQTIRILCFPIINLEKKREGDISQIIGFRSRFISNSTLHHGILISIHHSQWFCIIYKYIF